MLSRGHSSRVEPVAFRDRNRTGSTVFGVVENRLTQFTCAGGPRADHQVVPMPWPMSRDDELFGYIDQ